MYLTLHNISGNGGFETMALLTQNHVEKSGIRAHNNCTWANRDFNELED